LERESCFLARLAWTDFLLFYASPVVKWHAHAITLSFFSFEMRFLQNFLSGLVWKHDSYNLSHSSSYKNSHEPPPPNYKWWYASGLSVLSCLYNVQRKERQTIVSIGNIGICVAILLIIIIFKWQKH
jgi:hypothetical protein